MITACKDHSCRGNISLEDMTDPGSNQIVFINESLILYWFMWWRKNILLANCKTRISRKRQHLNHTKKATNFKEGQQHIVRVKIIWSSSYREWQHNYNYTIILNTVEPNVWTVNNNDKNNNNS